MSTEEKLEKCLIEIDKRIYRLRFITFDSPKDELRFLYNLLSDIISTPIKGCSCM